MPIDISYVKNLYEELRFELDGFHKKIAELEDLRYYEDKINLGSEEKPTGLEVHIGAASELIENVKGALTSNPPRPVFKALRSDPGAQENSDNREKFWGEWFRWVSKYLMVFIEFADAQTGLGMGILKGSYAPWPVAERKKRKGEGDAAYRERQIGLKRKWGPPFRLITIHPLTFFFRLGPGNMLTECIEHSYKPRRDVLESFGIESESLLDAKPAIFDMQATVGQPVENVRPLPYGMNTATMLLVTEYWRAPQNGRPGVYQAYINGRLAHEEEDTDVAYFIAFGRSNSSKDPDKRGMSVAEAFRKNEPTINRALTRMAEAADLLVRKRLTIELPEGSTDGVVIGEDNSPKPRTFNFNPGKAEALPPGAKVVDPFEGTQNVYSGMPFINLLMQLMGEHGVSPLFKGMSSGSYASGYRDNSLYLMAKSQFQYILDAYSYALADVVRWAEDLIVRRVRQEVWCREFSLDPKDIRDYPCELDVDVEPVLPQNIIGEGQFYDRMHARGHITRRMVLEKGLREGQPAKIFKERYLEDIQEQMKPMLYQDVMNILFGQQNPESQLVGSNGQPIGTGAQGQFQFSRDPRRAGLLVAGANGARGNPATDAITQAQQELGGAARAGQMRQPPMDAGSFPPGSAG